MSCLKRFSNKTCESFLKVWKLVSNQHFLLDVYTLHCYHPCFAWLSIIFTFKHFRFKSWPCCHWVKPRSTTCFFQFLITKYDDGRWVDFRKKKNHIEWLTFGIFYFFFKELFGKFELHLICFFNVLICAFIFQNILRFERELHIWWLKFMHYWLEIQGDHFEKMFN